MTEDDHLWLFNYYGQPFRILDTSVSLTDAFQNIMVDRNDVSFG